MAASLLLAIGGWLIPIPTSAHEPNQENKTLVEEPEKANDPSGVLRVNQEDINVPPIKTPKETVRVLPKRQPAEKTGTRSNPAPVVSSGRNYSKEEVRALIVQYSAQYGINSAVPLCIARLESGFNQHSKNRSSTASGVFQYLSGTWRATDEGKAGLSVFDADANIKAAIKYMASRRSTSPWEVRNKCPKL